MVIQRGVDFSAHFGNQASSTIDHRGSRAMTHLYPPIAQDLNTKSGGTNCVSTRLSAVIEVELAVLETC